MHLKRVLQDWELELLFRLDERGLAEVKQALDCGREKSVLVSHMVERMSVVREFKNVKLPKESVYRTRLIEEKNQHVNEILKQLIKVLKREIQQHARSLY
jgi:hypothetical protein